MVKTQETELGEKTKQISKLQSKLDVLMFKVDGLEQYRPQGYKTFFNLNSAEHEISNAHRYQNSHNQWKIQV